MIEVAHDHYGLAEDDRLNDSISSIASIFMSLGETTGPIAGSFLPMYTGYKITLTFYAFLVLAYAVFYALYSDVFRSTSQKTYSKLLETALVEI